MASTRLFLDYHPITIVLFPRQVTSVSVTGMQRTARDSAPRPVRQTVAFTNEGLRWPSRPDSHLDPCANETERFIRK